jgi:photosystem II stability/assembly factor-like uncharacterized protein
MRKAIFLLALAALCLTACASPALAPAQSAEQQAPGAAPLAQVKTDFTPTDPTTVSLAAGRPQLVEFYAVW